MNPSMTLFRCPRDGTPLRVMEDHGMRIRTCVTCHGLWVPAGQLSPRMPAAVAKEIFHLMPGEATDLLCPVDGAVMRELQVGGVRIDRCGTCRGLWFDAGELTMVSAAMGLATERAKISKPRRLENLGKDITEEVLVQAGVETVVTMGHSSWDGLGDVISALAEFLGSAISP